MFIRVLFTIAKLMNRNCGIYVYTMEYYSSINNEIFQFAATWMDLEGIKLNEINQIKMIYQAHRSENRLVTARGLQLWGREKLFLWGFLFCLDKFFKNFISCCFSEV